MNIAVLKTELTTDPLAFGYSGMTHLVAAQKLNATNTGRTLPRTSVGKNELLTAIVDSEWPSTAILQNKLLCIFCCDTIDASNTNVRGVFAAIFGSATTTRANLLALGTRTVSRGEELGLGDVTAGDVERARAA